MLVQPFHQRPLFNPLRWIKLEKILHISRDVNSTLAEMLTSGNKKKIGRGLNLDTFIFGLTFTFWSTLQVSACFTL